MEEQLQEQLATMQRTYRQAIEDGPVIKLQRNPSAVEAALTDEQRRELDGIGGPRAHEGTTLALGKDLLGKTDVKTVTLSLRRAIRLAAQNNLDVKVAQMQPAIRQTVITQAEAIFDAVYFASFDFEKLDTPQPPTSAFVSAAFGSVQRDTRQFQTGIRKVLTSGGQLTVATQMGRHRQDPSFFTTKTFYEANSFLNLTQPLLRGFGEDVARAQIMLTHNARAADVQALRRNLLEVALDTERAYWSLAFARYQLLVQQKLLDRTIQDRDRIEARLGHDATQVELTLANSFVESRRADLIIAVNQLRRASDALKRLINSPDLSVADEILIEPVDTPADLPIRFSLLDAVTTAIRRRPEMQQVLLNIHSASIRQRVADNARLPQLDLSATIRYSGIGSNTQADEGLGDAYDVVTDGEFIDYLVGLQFETPIGNRAPEALHRQRQLERHATVVTYQNVAQQIVLDVKTALRDVIDAYRLIDARRGTRLAASDHLRALEEQEKAGIALTPAFLDLRLRRTEALANAENQEMAALSGYQTAIAALYQAMGTLLEHNGIEFSNQLAK